ncbi:MAG: acyl-CoA reductase [Siphonobacter sp.]
MLISEKINAFSKLGTWLKENDLEEWAQAAQRKNGWFTKENVLTSLQKLADTYLSKPLLENWVALYPMPGTQETRKVGLVLAGNIPAVGFHDILCVLMAGHQAYIKPSSQDEILISGLLQKLVEIEPALEEVIVFTERMNDVDAVIATGSDNSARHFEYYFAKKPHLIRKNRTSVAVLTGQETPEELLALGKDVLTYYGLGCRNVSKLYVPTGYDFTVFFETIAPLDTITCNHKFLHNYDYNKSIYLVNRTPFLDNGFLMITESEALVSPISVLFFEYYNSPGQLTERLQQQANKLQCIVGNAEPAHIGFGQTQSPQLWDYADQVDTMQFLLSI